MGEDRPVHRLPAGERVCLDALTHPEPNGVATAENALFGERGCVGRALQGLLIEPS